LPRRSFRSPVIGIGDVAARSLHCNLPATEFSPPSAPRASKFRRRQVLRIRCGPFGCSAPFRAAAYPRNDTLSKGVNIMRQLAQFLTATGRRLRALGKVAGHFFRKGKLGLKLAIKIPFFVEIEIAFETDWDRRR
jgi:hypothetical protein